MASEVEALIGTAREARRERRLADAKNDLIKAVALCRHAGNRIRLAKAIEALGQIERDLHNPEQARKHYEEAVSIYRVENHELSLAHAIRHVADIHREMGKAADAESCYNYALWLYRDIKETTPLELANAIRGLALLKDESGDVAQAQQLWNEARDLYTAADVQAGVDESTQRLALLSKKSES
jgi:tetratricopeptide (TPR) repeat protein